MNYSDEQKAIIKAVKDYNIVVDAIAGSGKTTTIFGIAKEYTKENILLLTYNARLKEETENKRKEQKIDNLFVFSYHSFGYRYYNTLCKTDKGIEKALKENSHPRRNFSYDIIILDECQDLEPFLYSFFYKIYMTNTYFRNGKNAKLCIFGDKKQNIFSYKGADSKYITIADTIFCINDLPWKYLDLTMSYRITNGMAKFINECILRDDRMNACKEIENDVEYIICNTFVMKDNKLLDDVLATIKEYGEENIFVIAPSIKNLTAPIRRLANKLSNKYGIKMHIPLNDEEK
jgi:superfamily I DNA/RNA helicase